MTKLIIHISHTQTDNSFIWSQLFTMGMVIVEWPHRSAQPGYRDTPASCSLQPFPGCIFMPSIMLTMFFLLTTTRIVVLFELMGWETQIKYTHNTSPSTPKWMLFTHTTHQVHNRNAPNETYNTHYYSVGYNTSQGLPMSFSSLVCLGLSLSLSRLPCLVMSWEATHRLQA